MLLPLFEQFCIRCAMRVLLGSFPMSETIHELIKEIRVLTAPKAWLKPQEVAELLAVSKDTVHAWIQSGELAAANCSPKAESRKPRWRITQADLDAFHARRANVPAVTKPARQRRRRDKPPREYV